MPKRLVFLDWRRPAPAQAAEFLSRERSGRPLDLSDTLILVPTRHSGRRLREALARREGGAWIGRVDTPAAVFQPPPDRLAADDFVEEWAWCETLRSIDPVRFPSLRRFVGRRDPAGALRAGRPFARLRRLLCEEGRTLADAAAAPRPDAERERWAEWIRLETLFLEELARAGRRDGCRERLRAARNAPPGEWRRIVLLFTPDPPPLAVETLARWAEMLEVVVCVHAPESERDAFDEWGRPLPERWTNRELGVPEDSIRLYAGPREQAEAAAELAAALPGPLRPGAAIGMPDRSLAPFLEAALEQRGFRASDPEGRTAATRPPVATALAWLRAAFDSGRPAIDGLLRRPEILESLKADPDVALTEWDRLCADHLPDGLDDVRRVLRARAKWFPAIAAVLDNLIPRLEALRNGPPAAGLRRALAETYRDRTLAAGAPRDARFAEVAVALRETLDAFEAAGPALRDAPPPVAARLLTDAFEAIRVYPEREPESIDLLGWLELHWEDAPLLVIAGLSEGIVPETVSADPFLPGSARDALGLRGNETRLARDLYLFEAMTRSRPAVAPPLVLLGAADAIGEPLQPSRLLFRCAPAELPGRVLRLFAEPEPPEPAPPRIRAWRWKPPALDAVPLPARLSVTALRDYLACPFRYFLRHLLGMEPAEPFPRELDPLAFGSAAHAAWQRVGEDPSLRECAEERVLSKRLREAADRWLAGRYGPDPGVAVRLQCDALFARLDAAAAVEARERAAGWRIERVETTLSMRVGAFELRGRIDRIDRRPDAGRVRALDYKTSDMPAGPEEVHLRPARKIDPEWQRAPDGKNGKPRRWADLQLPLYLRMLRAAGTPAEDCGFFLMPRAAGETAVAVWDGFDAGLEESAARCAGEIARRIAARVFWPPAERPEYDDFETLFEDGVESALDPDWVRDAASRAAEADR